MDNATVAFSLIATHPDVSRAQRDFDAANADLKNTYRTSGSKEEIVVALARLNVAFDQLISAFFSILNQPVA